jgi:hypothetical protein
MRMQLIDHQTRLQLPGYWPRGLAPPVLNRMDHPTPFLAATWRPPASARGPARG